MNTEQKPKKDINCVSCKRKFICKGVLNPSMCINYEQCKDGERCYLPEEDKKNTN